MQLEHARASDNKTPMDLARRPELAAEYRYWLRYYLKPNGGTLRLAFRRTIDREAFKHFMDDYARRFHFQAVYEETEDDARDVVR